MNKNPVTANKVFDQLEGSWEGEGQGGYPTIEPFHYREKLTFTRRNETTLAYDQRTEKRMEGSQGFVASHWENGFISILDNGDLELVNAQSGGRGEVLTGRIEMIDSIIRLHCVSKALMNDARMISTARVFELDGDQLRYEMEMSTTKMDQLTQHLAITLGRVYDNEQQRKVAFAK
jgi:hypothetical protein